MYGIKTVRRIRECDIKMSKKKYERNVRRTTYLAKNFSNDELYGELLVAALAGY